MIYVAAGSLSVATLTIVAFASLLRAMIRSHARERDLLVNQLLHLAGRTWTPPPAAEPAELEFDPDRFLASPEQLP